jgi:hypothetical protein
MIKDKVKPEFLPCPFCGRTEYLSIEEDISEEDNDKHAYACHVICSCGARGRNNYPIGWVESDGQAIEALNDRFIPATIPSNDPKQVQVSLNALSIINYELIHIINEAENIKRQLTPVKMVK